jgi:hypothetical protein
MNQSDSSNTRKSNILEKWISIIKKPWVSQALWLIPGMWAIKNLIEVLFLWEDSITQRKFATKERLFKTLSWICAVSSWWIWIYSVVYDQEILDTFVKIGILQGLNRWNYLTGVYYSGELQKILQQHKEKIIYTKKVIWDTIKKHTTPKPKTIKKSKTHYEPLEE